MTDEEWLKEINEVKTNHYSLSKAETKRMTALRDNIPDEITTGIDELDPIGINELSYWNGLKRKQEPLVATALLKIKQRQKITAEEEEVLWFRKYINYSIQRRGVSFRGRMITGIVEDAKNNAGAIASTIITDIGLNLALGALTGGATTILSGIKIGKRIIDTARAFNKVRESYKVLKYGTNALKYIGLTVGSAKIDTLVRTHLIDNLTPSEIRAQTKNERLLEKTNDMMLQFTDKGGLYTEALSQKVKDFLQYQSDVETYNEALSERAVDPIIDGILGAIPISNKLKNSIIAKVLRTINRIPAITGTTMHSLGTEHLEEIFGMAMNHLMKANDPDTTLSQSLNEYLEPTNFALSTINILTAGGIIKATCNALNFAATPLKNNRVLNKLSSISRTVLKNYYKKQFEANPDQEISDLNKDNYERIIDNLTETQSDEIMKAIVNKEDRESREKYNTLMEQRRQDLIAKHNDEKTVNNLLKIYDVFYIQNSVMRNITTTVTESRC